MLIICAIICVGSGFFWMSEARKSDKMQQQYMRWGYDMMFETALEVHSIGKEVDELKKGTVA